MLDPSAPPLTHAMLLAAGLGRRMRPLTETIPKPLIQLGGRALIDWGIDRLMHAGVSHVIVNLHHHAEKIEAHLYKRHDLHLAFSDERAALLETGGGIRKALDFFKGTGFFTLNADSIWLEKNECACEKLKQRWNESKMEALLLLAPREKCIGYTGPGDFDSISDSGHLQFRKGDSAPFVYTGLSILHPRLFNGMSSPSDESFPLPVVWRQAEERGGLYGVVLTNGLFLHVGDPAGLAQAESILKQWKTQEEQKEIILA